MVWTLLSFLNSTDLSILHTSGRLAVFESLVSGIGFTQYRASHGARLKRPEEVGYYMAEHLDMSLLLTPEDFPSS